MHTIYLFSFVPNVSPALQASPNSSTQDVTMNIFLITSLNPPPRADFLYWVILLQCVACCWLDSLVSTSSVSFCSGGRVSDRSPLSALLMKLIPLYVCPHCSFSSPPKKKKSYNTHHSSASVSEKIRTLTSCLIQCSVCDRSFEHDVESLCSCGANCRWRRWIFNIGSALKILAQIDWTEKPQGAFIEYHTLLFTRIKNRKTQEKMSDKSWIMLNLLCCLFV